VSNSAVEDRRRRHRSFSPTNAACLRHAAHSKHELQHWQWPCIYVKFLQGEYARTCEFLLPDTTMPWPCSFLEPTTSFLHLRYKLFFPGSKKIRRNKKRGRKDPLIWSLPVVCSKKSKKCLAQSLDWLINSNAGGIEHVHWLDRAEGSPTQSVSPRKQSTVVTLLRLLYTLLYTPGKETKPRTPVAPRRRPQAIMGRCTHN
jgi:hypothetical protein